MNAYLEVLLVVFMYEDDDDDDDGNDNDGEDDADDDDDDETLLSMDVGPNETLISTDGVSNNVFAPGLHKVAREWISMY